LQCQSLASQAEFGDSFCFALAQFASDLPDPLDRYGVQKVEESIQAFLGPIFANVEQSFESLVELVHQCQVLVAAWPKTADTRMFADGSRMNRKSAGIPGQAAT
jgi:hypothetical protein